MTPYDDATLRAAAWAPIPQNDGPPLDPCRNDPACSEVVDMPGRPWAHSILCALERRTK